jgi:hypothetical protein
MKEANRILKLHTMRSVLPVIIFLLTNTCYNKAYCQRKNEVGVSLQLEKTAYHMENVEPGATKTTQADWNFSFGVLYEWNFSKHPGCQVGLKYRRAINDISIPVPSGANSSTHVHYFISENFLSLPVQYKYNSRVINFSAGMSLDYFLSWKTSKNGSYFVPLPSYDRFFDRKLSVGWLAVISKKISIDRKIVIEPGFYYNPILSFKRNYFGVSVAIKHML